MTFLDLTVEVRSILIRHYVLTGNTRILSLQNSCLLTTAHEARKGTGHESKKRGVGGRKKKNKRSHSPNPSWSRFLLRFCLLPQSTSKPLLRKLLSSLPACHSRSQLVSKLCRVTPLLKKITDKERPISAKKQGISRDFGVQNKRQSNTSNKD